MKKVTFLFSLFFLTALQIMAVEKNINNTAGGLNDELGADAATVTSLTVTGTIDARDFKTIRDNTAALVTLDLSGATIVAYTGTEGTMAGNKTYNADEVPERAFYASTSPLKNTLETVSIPATTLVVNGSAFRDLGKLQTFTFPDNVTTIETTMFQNCNNLTSITLPASLTTLNALALDGYMNKLATLTIAGSNLYFKTIDNVLYNKDETVLIRYAMNRAGTEYVIPSTVTELNNKAFYGSKLKYITIPASLETIKDGAFQNCMSLISIVIPSTVQTIGASAFSNCQKLVSIVTDLETPPDVNVNVFQNVKKNECTIYAPAAALSEYENGEATAWNGFSAYTAISSLITYTGGPVELEATGETKEVEIESNPLLATLGVEMEIDLASFEEEAWLTAQKTATGISLNAPLNDSGNDRAATVNVYVLSPKNAISITVEQEKDNSVPDNEKNINNTAGGLSTALGADINIVTSLTVTGTIDARDFKTIRDNMDVLATLDLSAANIVAYTGTEGTMPGNVTYNANEVPGNAFYAPTSALKNTLEGIALPTTALVVNDNAFAGLEKLRSFAFPDNVATIGAAMFQNCTNLTSVTLPASLATLNALAFDGPIGKLGTVTIAESNPHFKTTVNVLFNKEETKLLYYAANKPDTKYVIPVSVTEIGDKAFQGSKLHYIIVPGVLTSIKDAAFQNCTELVSIIIPSTVQTIGENAFSNCLKLTSIVADLETPINVNANVFQDVKKDECVIYAPATALNAYENGSATAWNGFSSYVAIADLITYSTSPVTLTSIAQTKIIPVTLNQVLSNLDVTVIVDDVTFEGGAPWLTAQAVDNGISIDANVNDTGQSRTATVHFYVLSNNNAKTITVTQAKEGDPAPGDVINNVAGGLNDALGANAATITSLTVTGTIDARDFKTIRDNMAVLTTLDLSGATIVEYTGTEGTVAGNKTYNANEVPERAFYASTSALKTTLENVTLPATTQVVNGSAFRDLSKLQAFTFPDNVVSIGSTMFQNCTNLASITLPASLTTLNASAFDGYMNKLTAFSIAESNTHFKTRDNVLFDKAETILLRYPMGKEGAEYVMPATVKEINNKAFYGSGLRYIVISDSLTTIKDGAFQNCMSLISVSIPSTVETIGASVFSNCQKLTSIVVDVETPIEVNANVFQNVKKNECVICVPETAVEAYKTVWDGFSAYIPISNLIIYSTEPVELAPLGETKNTPVVLDPVLSNLGVTVQIDSVVFENENDGEWLTVQQAEHALSLTAPENTTQNNRTATVKFYVLSKKNTGEITVNQAKQTVSSIPDKENDDVKILITGNTIQLSGLSGCEVITVFNLQGRVIYNAAVSGETAQITVPNNGVYVIKVDTEILKVLIK